MSLSTALAGLAEALRAARWKTREFLQSFNIVAINDTADAKTLAHLFKYDSNIWKVCRKGDHQTIIPSKLTVTISRFFKKGTP